MDKWLYWKIKIEYCRHVTHSPWSCYIFVRRFKGATDIIQSPDFVVVASVAFVLVDVSSQPIYDSFYGTRWKCHSLHHYRRQDCPLDRLYLRGNHLSGRSINRECHPTEVKRKNRKLSPFLFTVRVPWAAVWTLNGYLKGILTDAE